jgi:hypothetical protein
LIQRHEQKLDFGGKKKLATKSNSYQMMPKLLCLAAMQSWKHLSATPFGNFTYNLDFQNWLACHTGPNT